MLGIRHFRDEVRPDNHLERWRQVFRQAGIRWHLLVSPATNTIPELLGFLRALDSGAVSAVEGQNEGDSPWFKAQKVARPGWAGAVIDYQRQVFRALRESFPLLPVVSPTVLDYLPDDMRSLLPAADFSDVVALHAYVQAQQEPETEDPYAGIAWYLQNMRDRFKPAAPVMVTETGYTTAPRGISAHAAGIYVPRLLLHLFDRGITRSFIYELMDEGHAAGDPEQHFGLLTPEAAPKPAFHSLRLLLDGLRDPGPAFAPAPITLAVEAGPADLRMMAFRKREGAAVLALWRAVRVWDPRLKRDLAPPSVPTRLYLPSAAAAQTTGLAVGGAWADARLARERITVEVGASVRLIRVTF